MENGQAPFNAIEMGRIAEVEAWLDNGGDPTMFSDIEPDRSLLRCAARRGRAEIISLLLSRGADIDATDADGRTAVYEMLNHWTRHSSLPALRLLLSHGADVNLARTNGGFLSGRSPLMIASICNEQGPDIIRLLLRAGADPEHRGNDSSGRPVTAEESYRSSRSMYSVRSADLLRDVRLAGGWVRYALQPHYDLLVLRALRHRGRATFSARTPEVLVRLFGAPAQVRRRTRSAAREGVHVPDPLFWRVLEFSLRPVYDYPWVRERLRARAAAAAAAAAAE